jgi:hypothetical protein
MHRTLAVALATSLALLPSTAQAVPTDRGYGYALCASIIGVVTRTADVPAGLMVRVRDERFARDRSALMTGASTVEDRHGNAVRRTIVRRGDRVDLYVPAQYVALSCTLSSVPKVAFAQDLSR